MCLSGHGLDCREEGLHCGRRAEEVSLRVGIRSASEDEGLGRGGRGEEWLEELLLLLDDGLPGLLLSAGLV